MQAAVLMVLLVGGAFSYYQLGSPLFGCGTVLAGPEIYLWMALCAVQSLLFLAGALSRPARRVYRVLQYLTLPLAAIPLAQIAATDARIFACVAVAAIGYWYVVARRRSPASPHPAGGASRDIGSSITETAAFLLAMLVIHSAFAFLVLHTPGMALDDRRFVLIGAASAALAAALVRFDRPLASLSIAEVPPIALLVVVLLRAKLPDGAYDSLFYKATVPIMIADWRTAITGALDHTLLGTDFLEIVNSQLRIADPRYSPALTGSFAFLGMWAIVPAAARSVIPAWTGGAHGLARNVLALLLVSMTGPLVAAGTAYQEPMLSLLMAAALLPLSLAWVFLAAAVAVKVTAGFIAPLIVLARCWPLRALWRQDRLEAQDGGRSSTAAFVARVAGELRASMRSRALLLAICLVLAAVTFGEQFYRNLAYTGRLTGLTETFVGLTDPDGHVLALEKDDPAEALVPHGFRQRYANTFIHVLTLDRWIKTTEFGFHVIPSSRLPAIAAVLCLLVLAFPALRRNRPLLCSFALWLLCSVVLLHFVSQGRYLLPASLGAALVIAYLLGTAMQAAEASGRGRILGAAIALVVAFVAFGDQLVGSFINDGWVCRRDLFAPVVKNNYDRPETAIEARLLDLAARQRSASPSRSVIPTILCENTVDRMRYVGAHYEFAQYSLALNLRRLAAHPSDARLLPTTLLAVCFTSDAFVGEILPPDVRKDFVEMEPVKTDAAGLVRILASRPLLAGARPTTLVGDRFDPLGWLRSSASVAAGPRRLGLASARREDRQAAR